MDLLPLVRKITWIALICLVPASSMGQDSPGGPPIRKVEMMSPDRVREQILELAKTPLPPATHEESFMAGRIASNLSVHNPSYSYVGLLNDVACGNGNPLVASTTMRMVREAMSQDPALAKLALNDPYFTDERLRTLFKAFQPNSVSSGSIVPRVFLRRFLDIGRQKFPETVSRFLARFPEQEVPVSIRRPETIEVTRPVEPDVSIREWGKFPLRTTGPQSVPLEAQLFRDHFQGDPSNVNDLRGALDRLTLLTGLKRPDVTGRLTSCLKQVQNAVRLDPQAFLGKLEGGGLQISPKQRSLLLGFLSYPEEVDRSMPFPSLRLRALLFAARVFGEAPPTSPDSPSETLPGPEKRWTGVTGLRLPYRPEIAVDPDARVNAGMALSEAQARRFPSPFAASSIVPKMLESGVRIGQPVISYGETVLFLSVLRVAEEMHRRALAGKLNLQTLSKTDLGQLAYSSARATANDSAVLAGFAGSAVAYAGLKTIRIQNATPLFQSLGNMALILGATVGYGIAAQTYTDALEGMSEEATWKNLLSHPQLLSDVALRLSDHLWRGEFSYSFQNFLRNGFLTGEALSGLSLFMAGARCGAMLCPGRQKLAGTLVGGAGAFAAPFLPSSIKIPISDALANVPQWISDDELAGAKRMAWASLDIMHREGDVFGDLLHKEAADEFIYLEKVRGQRIASVLGVISRQLESKRLSSDEPIWKDGELRKLEAARNNLRNFFDRELSDMELMAPVSCPATTIFLDRLALLRDGILGLTTPFQLQADNARARRSAIERASLTFLPLVQHGAEPDRFIAGLLPSVLRDLAEEDSH